ncbi:MAG: CbtB-domain containing protein [Methylocystis sp.]|nr:CbtB-domain containing protein [Methylocystis sp.]
MFDATAKTAARNAPLARSEKLTAAMVALVIGFGLVFVAGFAAPAQIHDAAHDTRHALSFPCH